MQNSGWIEGEGAVVGSNTGSVELRLLPLSAHEPPEAIVNFRGISRGSRGRNLEAASVCVGFRFRSEELGINMRTWYRGKRECMRSLGGFEPKAAKGFSALPRKDKKILLSEWTAALEEGSMLPYTNTHANYVSQSHFKSADADGSSGSASAGSSGASKSISSSSSSSSSSALESGSTALVSSSSV